MALVLSAALTIGGLGGGTALAADPNAQAQGQFLSGSVLALDLATLASLAPASATNNGTPATVTDLHPLNVTALNLVDVDLGGGLNLLGQNGLLTLGAVNQTAAASATGSSRASSGAVDDSGAIAVGSPGVAPADASLNLAPIITGVPALGTALSSGGLTVGALAATASQTAAGVQAGTYEIASLGLNVTSPLVSGITTGLTTTLTGLQSTVNTLPALIHALLPVATVGGVPDVAALVGGLTTVTSADGSIVANLKTGVVSIDVAKVVLTATGLELDHQPPNTPLLPLITAALTSQLLPAIVDALTGTNGLVAQLTAAITGISVKLGTVAVPLSTLAPILNPVITTVTAPVSTVAAGLGSTVITPLASALGLLVGLRVNVQPSAPNGTGPFTQRALQISLVPLANASTINLASATVGPNAGPQTPTTASIAPDHGPAAGGTTVVLTGAGFAAGATTVTIGGTTIAAGDVSVNPTGTTATFTTPAHAVGTVQVTATTAGGTSTPALSFTYDAPTATGLTPDHGPTAGGTSVAVTGSGFVPGSTTVTIGGSTVPATVTNGGTTATFTTPGHAPGAVTVTVTTPQGTTTPALTFNYGPPTTSGLNPSHGPAAGGTSVVLTGVGFVPDATSVTIGATTIAASDVTVNPAGTSVTFTTPAHAVGTVQVTATTAGGTSTPALTYTYDAPTAASLTPDHGTVAGGTSVAVTGTGFVPGSTTVTIGGSTVPATVTNGGTTATFTTPAHAPGAVGVTVTTPDGTTTPALTYTYGPPTTSGLNPNHGPAAGGTSVVVTGTGFVPGATTIAIGGATVAAADVTVDPTGTTATFLTPAHPVGAVQLSVTTAGGASTPALTFTYDAPTAASLTPDHGTVAGGTTVAVTGTGFVPGSTTVTIGGSTVPATVGNGGTTATFTTPAHAPGAVSVTVTTPDGTTTPALTYTYGPPTTSGLNPNHGPAAGGTSVVVTGVGFVPGATTVTIGGITIAATDVAINANRTTATFTTPAHAVGSVGVTVTTDGGTSTPSLLYSFDPPVATGISPNHGPTAGGTAVAVTGIGFVPGSTSVTIGGITVAPADVTITGGGTIAAFTTPAHGAGRVDVTVTTPDGTTTPALSFVYGPPTTTAALSPNHGPAAGGTSVQVTGNGFVQGDTTVKIGGMTIAASDVTVNAEGTTATFVTPAHAVGTVDVTLSTAGGTSTPPLPFTYDLPTAIGLVPNHGPVIGGTSVVVTGTGFVPGSTSVLIGGTSVPAVVNSAGTTATFTTPAHAPGAVDVTLTTAGGTTTPALTFVYGPPTASGLLPSHGQAAGGTTVVITGLGFVPDATNVVIGGSTVAAANVTVNAEGTSATFTAPAHAVGPVTVVATTPGGTSTPALTYTYDPPSATSLSPNHGVEAGGTSVTITGAGFVAGQTSVTIGGITVPPAGVAVNGTGTTAVFLTPPHAAGSVPVSVTTPQGTTTPALAYLYGPADLPAGSCVLTGVNPDTGLNAATVTVLADVGPNAALVPSTFAVTVGGQVVGTPISVTPLFGGFLAASISVPVADDTAEVGYTLAPVVPGAYSILTGGPISCTRISGPQTHAGTYHPLTPFRMLDTRFDNPIPAGGTLTLQILGRGGVPATGVATVVLNLTATRSAKVGFLTVYPGGTRPNTSSVNYSAGQTVANLIVAPVAADGTVKIYNGSAGVTDVVADVNGYFSDGETVAPGSFVRLDPERVLDTTAGIGVLQAGLVPAGGSIKVKVTDIGGVPATNVAAVALNVTVDRPGGIGFITVYPNEPRPLISSLNFDKGATDANLVISPVAEDGTVTLYNGSNGTVRLIADVSGFFRGGIPVLDGEFVAVEPSRILDTRYNINLNGKVGAHETIAPTVLGRNLIPATGVSAVILNVTVTSTRAPGFITVYPDEPRPLASNLNYVAKQNRPNAVIGPVGAGGKVRLYNGSPQPLDLVSDVSGYFISRPLP